MRATCLTDVIFYFIIIIIFKNIILSVVLYGCETWSLTLRKKRGLRVFENRVLRRIFGPKREWRKLHNEELHDLNCAPSIVRVIKSIRLRRVGHVARIGERRGVYKFWVGKPEGKRPLEDPGLDERIILK
jgi:hypothetical protein